MEARGWRRASGCPLRLTRQAIRVAKAGSLRWRSTGEAAPRPECRPPHSLLGAWSGSRGDAAAALAAAVGAVAHDTHTSARVKAGGVKRQATQWGRRRGLRRA
eukprot:6189873-Pleurochrysis_carterae.AAC.3